MIERVAEAITRHSMFAPGDRVAVAVSGGADSVCLLHVLHELRPRWNLALSVIHINHLLRGAESDADEQVVRALAESLDLPLLCERIDIAALAAAPGANLEQTARDARRQVFLQELNAGRVDRVTLAHTRSDQAETVLFRFLRGSYTTGLAGMRPVTPEGIVRPLLEIDRSDVEEFLTSRGLTWREDHTNQDQRFARNRIRHYWMPALAGEWNANLPRLLAQHAVLAQEDEAYWSAEVERLAPHLFTSTHDAAIIVDVSEFERIPNALARRIVRRVFELVRGDLRQIDFQHIDQALALIRDTSSGHLRLQVPGVDILRSFEWVRFAKPAQVPPERDFEIALAVPSNVRMPGSDDCLTVELVETEGSDYVHATLRLGLDWNRIQFTAGVESAPGTTPLTLRNWRPGDAYQPVGDQHEVKLKTLFHDARIPLWERRQWPVITAGGRILWSKRFGPASDVAADQSTSTILRIQEKKSLAS